MNTLALALLPLLFAATAAGAGENIGHEPDSSLVDAIVRKLESSGALDRAVEQALTRVMKREQEAQRASQAQRQAGLQERAKAIRRVVPDRDHTFGKAGAEVSLIEFSDFECPFCKAFHATVKTLVSRPDARVNWVYRHYTLPFHEPAARREAIASECAAEAGGNTAFWRYAEALFAITRSNGQGLPAGTSEPAIAKQVGLDQKAFDACMAGRKAATRVEGDLAEGQAIGIYGTPTTIVQNNRTGDIEVIVGNQPLEALRSAVGRLLAATR